MLCHVCEAQAIGQCSDCRKGYCAYHGDRVCVLCAEAVALTPSAARPFRVPEPRPHEQDFCLAEYQAGGWGGDPREDRPRCFRCSAVPVGTCGRCRRYCCRDHRGSGWLYADPIVCKGCYEGIKRGYLAWLAIAGVVAMGLVIFYLVLLS